MKRAEAGRGGTNAHAGRKAVGAATPVVNLGYRSTNYWLIGGGERRLLVDLGWPGSLGAMRAALARSGVAPEAVAFGLATHYHLDHAGLGEELKQFGMRLIVVDIQRAAIAAMRAHIKPQDHYVEISGAGNRVISAAAGRALLAEIGLAGEILPTPGHSADSVSVLLDDGAVFTGDLPAESMATEAELPQVTASWRLLRERGARRWYPAHGPVRAVPAGR
jgi:ribonuclease/clavin/mitogillin